jgi:hypothetical protein
MDDARLDDVRGEIRQRADDAPRLDRAAITPPGIDALELQPSSSPP